MLTFVVLYNICFLISILRTGRNTTKCYDNMRTKRTSIMVIDFSETRLPTSEQFTKKYFIHHKIFTF